MYVYRINSLRCKLAERWRFSPIVRESHQLRRKFKTAASQIQGSAQNQPSRHPADEVIRQSRPSHLETTETAPYPWVAVWLALRTRPRGLWTNGGTYPGRLSRTGLVAHS